ncbi:MAG: YbaN family protein [Candidatus Bathyarchaeota archaeon]|nr:MAG: YbaN family protein [Candidatus Bathyarchaeota archaeon]
MEEKKASRVLAFKKKGQKLARALWLIAGTICLVLGAIGIVLPILPTTPFLLAAAACYYKSSPRMHNWLLNNKWFGEYIRNYKEGKGLSAKTKIFTLTILWITMGVSTVFMLNRILPAQLVLPMQLIMIAVAIVVSMHILRLPTFKKT